MGSEFQGAFDAMLESMGLTHYWTYPKSPRMNAHCERFNRTVQEQFVDWHEELLFTDLELFNQKLSQWLIDYNTVLPHHSLDLKAPVQWLLENHKECQRYWTNTDLLRNGPILCQNGRGPEWNGAESLAPQGI